MMATVSCKPVRQLSLRDLHLEHLVEAAGHGSQFTTQDKCELDVSDPLLEVARSVQEMGYAGIILSGPPGTGKTWYAQQIAIALSGNWDAVRSVQFHPSYQYEDFVFGYAPTRGGEFELREKELARICRDAAKHPEITHVLVIDEINRSDIVRVFGEAFTYIEPDKRELPFQTASGEQLTIPRNVIFIGTMNPWDKGVDEVDIALERRFIQVDLYPDGDVLRQLLAERGADSGFVDRLMVFFGKLQSLPLETVHLGHAYFLPCTSVTTARQVWKFRLRPTLRRACNLEPALFEEIEAAWTSAVQEENSEVQTDQSTTDGPPEDANT